MERVIIYGANESGQKILRELKMEPFSQNAQPNFEIIAFADRNSQLWGTEIMGVKVIDPRSIPQYSFETIIIAAIAAVNEIFHYLVDSLSIPKEKINREYIDAFYRSRQRFLLDQAEIIYKNKIVGSVAEVGVFQGEFAKYINAYFPDRNLYLFDTFSSYDNRDIEMEKQKGIEGAILSRRDKYLDTSVEYVKSVLPHPELAIFKVGYFPETAFGIEEKFAFVNLDVNLYLPTLAALEFFYPRMQTGGVILCHDFFSWNVEPGASMAINDFREKNGLEYVAVGDRMSIAFLKQ